MTAALTSLVGERGTIISINRQGEPEEFPLMSISVAVIPNRRRRANEDFAEHCWGRFQ